MVLGCKLDNGGRRQRLKALRRRATHRCMQQACTPYLGLRVIGRAHENQCHTAVEDQTKLFVPILCDVGVLIFCQPIIHHQSMSNAFSLVCCACTLPACSPLLAVRARHLPTHAHLKCNSLVFKNMPAANHLGVDI